METTIALSMVRGRESVEISRQVGSDECREFGGVVRDVMECLGEPFGRSYDIMQFLHGFLRESDDCCMGSDGPELSYPVSAIRRIAEMYAEWDGERGFEEAVEINIKDIRSCEPPQGSA